MADIVIATRESPLALWQANHVKAALEQAHPELRVTLLGMTSRGDQLLDSPLSKLGGKGLFVKELETALLEGRADIAVHSMKDVPMHFPDGLSLGPICARETPNDAFVSHRFSSIDELPAGAIVGTSSLRRESQLRAYRPDLQVKFLRGNVNTRLAKLDDGQYDAIILAAAGLIRLGFEDRIRALLSYEQSLPAGGQGAVGIELRSADAATRRWLDVLHDPKTAAEVTAERALNRTLNGGCKVPIAAFCLATHDILWLRGLVASVDGRTLLQAEARGPWADAELLGETVAHKLLSQGAQAILDEVYAAQ